MLLIGVFVSCIASFLAITGRKRKQSAQKGIVITN